MTIGNEPNGLNINAKVGSTDTKALQAKVNEVRADIGIALDGDADRVILVDEKSEVVDGDQLMALVAQSWQESGELRGGGIVATVMSNLGLERFLADRDLSLARTAVGDRHVVEHMRKHGFNLGGEQSGHIVMSDYATTGDGLLAALQVMSVVKRWDRPVSEVCHRFEPVPQFMRNVRFAPRDGGEPLNDNRVRDAIKDGHMQARSGRAARDPQVGNGAAHSHHGRRRRPQAGARRGRPDRGRGGRRRPRGLRRPCGLRRPAACGRPRGLYS